MKICCSSCFSLKPSISQVCVCWTSFILGCGWADRLLILSFLAGKDWRASLDIRYTAERWCNPYGHYGNCRTRSWRLLILISPHLFFQSLPLSTCCYADYHSSTSGKRCEELSRLKGRRRRRGSWKLQPPHTFEMNVQTLLLHPHIKPTYISLLLSTL